MSQIQSSPNQPASAQAANRHSFFRNYVPASQVNVDARFGDYPASIFGSWDPGPAGCATCGRGASIPIASAPHPQIICSHSFTLHPAAKEIAFLLKCRDLPDTDFWKVAEEEWRKNVKAAQKTVDAKEAKVASLTSEIYQVVGLAAAFQGLLITAASQLAASDNCGNRVWWFFALSVFAALVTGAGVQYKVWLVKFSLGALDTAKPILRERERLLMMLTETDGPGFDLVHSKRELGKLRTILKFLDRTHVFEYSGFILICLSHFGVICAIALIFICM